MNYLKWLQDKRLMNEAGDGSDSGGGAPPAAKQDPPASATFTQEQVQNLIDQALAKNTAQLEEKFNQSLSGIKKNRDEILTEKKQLQQKMRENELAQQMIDGDVEGARKEIRADLEAEYAEREKNYQEQLAKFTSQSDNDFRERELNSHLNDLRVKSVLRDDLMASLTQKSSIEKDNDGNRRLVIDGKPVKDYFEEWAKSDKAEHYVVANPSSGGGGQGSGTTSGAQSSFEQLEKFEGADLIMNGLKLQNKK